MVSVVRLLPHVYYIPCFEWTISETEVQQTVRELLINSLCAVLSAYFSHSWFSKGHHALSRSAWGKPCLHGCWVSPSF